MRELTSPFDAGFTPAAAADLAAVLKAAADPTRLRMLHLLYIHGPGGGVDLGKVIPLSQPTISYHLRLLTEAGLITSRREDGCVLRKLDRVALAVLAGLLAPGGSWLAVDALRTGDPS